MVKTFKCSFWGGDVLCSFKKSDKFVVLRRCLKCSHSERFMREMEQEEDEFFDEVDRVRREGRK